MVDFFTAGVLMAGLGGLLSVVLIFANKKLTIEEDPRIDQVESMLPNANCGACGKAGCRAFAEAVVAGEIAPGKCTVNTTEGTNLIAHYLGVDAGSVEKRVARLACAGGHHVSWMRARYEGHKTCRGAALVAGGGKGCSWGCLGLGDCMRVCSFGAIHMNEYGLPVVDVDKCTACGDCVDICPKDLFEIHPVDHRLWVACKSLTQGDEAEAECAVACTACGRCAADAPNQSVQIINGLAIVDYSKNYLLTNDIIQRCPTGAIVWYENNQNSVKGMAAKRITRHSPLPLGGKLM